VGAKDIRVSPLTAASARDFVRRWHYSGKPYPKSRLHLGAFMGDRLIGVMQFGDPLDRRKVLGLVSGTKWHDMIELNRMAMVDDTPKNAESRFISVAMRLIRKEYSNIEWVLSFSDACQCGDGTIYRAAGFVLTQIKKNAAVYRIGNYTFTDVGFRTSAAIRKRLENMSGVAMHRISDAAGAGARPIEGFQLRYVYFLNREARSRLTVPEVPYSEISTAGAGMYLGHKRVKQAMAGVQPEQRQGSTDPHAPISEAVPTKAA